MEGVYLWIVLNLLWLQMISQAEPMLQVSETEARKCCLINRNSSNASWLWLCSFCFENTQCSCIWCNQESSWCPAVLEQYQVEHLYYKYCSTFDSTPKGNIGPVMDFLLDYYDLTYITSLIDAQKSPLLIYSDAVLKDFKTEKKIPCILYSS